MRVFVTGATGFIGSAVVRDLISAGHQVLGLARTTEGAATLTRLGAKAHAGELSDTESLAAGAQSCDGVIHTAFMRASAGYASSKAAAGYVDFAEADRLAIMALGAALAGSGRPLVVTSGTFAIIPGRIGTEADAGDVTAPAGARVPSEEAALAMAAQGVRATVVRLPPTVHGNDDKGFVPALIGVARKTGASAYVGDGLNRWPAVHRMDAARLFRLALENGIAGARYHAVAEEGVSVRDIAEVIGRRLALPVHSISPEQAAEQFGRLGPLIAVDGPASSALTRRWLGWTPSWPGLIVDVDRGRYFTT